MATGGRATEGLSPAPLIETKMVPPRRRPELVTRPRLLEAVDQLSSTALTLVAAPVGFGKTVLAQTWSAQSDTPLAWVSIDAADNDPVRLWTYVATAVDRIRRGLGRGALSRLRASGATPEAAVDELVNGIAAYGQPLTVVLDDLHSLENEACYASFGHAVEHLPAHARIVATTRSDPPIPLARLRARGVLGEIRAGELAFTFDEARAMIVEQEGIDLSPADVEMLLDRTEGWPAGLYLATLWLRTLDDPSAGVREFHGDHRQVADYLTGEVLDTLDADTRDFLLQTSILGRFTAVLCDAVLERRGSARVIADIERSNLFLVALDTHGEWFRYHHLFGKLLRLELARVDQAAPTRLHRRAADWCRRHGLIEDALKHAHQAGDDELVATLLVDSHLELSRSGRNATLLRWLSTLPSEQIVGNSILAPAGALASVLLGRPTDERRRLLGLAGRASAEHPESWTTLHEVAVGLAQAVSVDSDVGDAVTSARHTAEIARGEDEVAVPALANLGYLLYLAGELPEARAAAQEAVDRPEAADRPLGYVYALATLSLVDVEQGGTEDAESTARRALEVALASGVGETAAGGLAHVALAAAHAAAGRLPAAERSATRGERLRRQTEADASHVHALLVLAAVHAQRGQLAQASAALERAKSALGLFRDPGSLRARSADVEHSIERAANAEAPREPPSEAELSVLRLLATDMTQRQIGATLYLSVNTVKTHTRTLYRKLGVTSREEAVTKATALGLFDGKSPG